MNNYSGIIAIIVYSLILYAILTVNKNRKKKAVSKPAVSKGQVNDFAPLDENDEDALVACLVAAIECREELHKNVEIIGVRRID